MQAIGHAVLEKRGKTRVCYITCESFTNEYIDALQNNNVSAFRKKYRKIDLLLIDDIHFLDGKKAYKKSFFTPLMRYSRVINRLYSPQIVRRVKWRD